jgi:hypothetical protein
MAMEILSLLLEEAATNPQFGFHPKCHSLKLTHLCFADDLLIFSAASMNSIQLIKKVLYEFEDLSGLKANPAKSLVFCAGISDRDKGAVLDLLHMSEGTLPVRYLGVPLITKRLSAVERDILVAKIVVRIESWLVKNLTFAGRLQLITSVLCSFQVFWSRVFILPKKVVKLLEQKLNRFLWCGEDTKAKAKVAWDKVCVPKKEGGLGIKKLDFWNQASMLYHVWVLFARSGSLWVAWVEDNLLKGRSFWQVPTPQNCSWSWRKLLKLRNIAKQFISFKVGDGRKIFLWYAVWHPEGCLFDKYGYRIIYDAGRSIGPRVSSIIRDGAWYWPSAMSDDLVQVQCRLPEVEIGRIDSPIWKSSTGKYSCSQTWEQIRHRSDEVVWQKVVWYALAIPKHAFILWLVFSDALITKEKMCTWGFTGSTLCLSCFACQESRDHLFFSCSFSRRVWKSIMADCLVYDPPVDWDSVSSWCVARLKDKSLHATICRLCFGATIYHLWRHRNDLLHGNSPRSEEALIKQVKWEVRSRLLARGSAKKIVNSFLLVQKWSLHPLLSV